MAKKHKGRKGPNNFSSLRVGICLLAFPIALLVITMKSRSPPPEAVDAGSGSFAASAATNLAALGADAVQEVRALREQWDSPPAARVAAVNNAIHFAPLPELNTSSDNPVWERKRRMIGSDAMTGWLNDCPMVPQPGYPQEFPIMDLIENWNPDDATVPARHYSTLCRFDFQKPGDLDKAFAYREAELPFIVYNAPEAEDVVQKWNKPGYLENLLGNERYRTEVSHNNHFMYHSGGGRTGGKGKQAWRAPTTVEKMSYKKFKEAADRCDQNNCSETEQHFYFRVTAPASGHFIFKELPFFKPKPSIFIKDPKGQRGIHCRFGMREVIAENHYDGSRNTIGLFGGRRRYVLSHPKECENMYLLPMGHPSGRHSGDACNYHPDCKDSPTSVDYSKPDLDRFPKFRKLMANEVILTAGDFLYLPTHWFHYIISMGLNFQCNTRSGRSNEYQKFMKKCGFK